MAYIREGVNAQICRASITYIPNVEKTGSTDPRGKGSATYCKTAPMNWTAEQARLPPGSKNTARFIGRYSSIHGILVYSQACFRTKLNFP